jgi:hypothetical protein
VACEVILGFEFYGLIETSSWKDVFQRRLEFPGKWLCLWVGCSRCVQIHAEDPMHIPESMEAQHNWQDFVITVDGLQVIKHQSMFTNSVKTLDGDVL